MNMHNWTDEYLADVIGAKDADIKADMKVLDEMKDEAKRRGIESATGEDFKITVSMVESNRLDTKALRELLGDALDPYYKKCAAPTLRIIRLFKQPEVVG